MESLVEETIHPLGGGIPQSHAQIVIERLEVSGLKTLEDVLAPNDKGGNQVELFACCSRIVKLIFVDDVKPDRGPGLCAVIPPCVLVFKMYAGPEVEGDFDSIVFRSADAPA